MDRLYSTTALIKVLDTLDRPTAFLKDKLFGEMRAHSSCSG